MAGPLEGVMIVEFARTVLGPLFAMMPADHGADLIRIDRPGTTLDPLHRSRTTVLRELADAS